METSTTLGTARGRLHPLLAAAAVSVTVFSAVGVAAIAGLIPHSKGQPKEETRVAAVAAPVTEPSPVVQAAPTPAPKPVKKPVVRHMAATELPPLAQAPQTVEAPKPVQKPGVRGVVESVKE